MKNKSLRVFLFLLFVAWTLPSLASSRPTEEDSIVTVGNQEILEHIRDFKALPRKERKQKLKEANRLWKEFRSQKTATADEEIVFLAILAVLLPPVAVLLKEKKINKRFWICLLLSLLFLLPGIVYALLIVFGVIQ